MLLQGTFGAGSSPGAPVCSVVLTARELQVRRPGGSSEGSAGPDAALRLADCVGSAAFPAAFPAACFSLVFYPFRGPRWGSPARQRLERTFRVCLVPDAEDNLRIAQAWSRRVRELAVPAVPAQDREYRAAAPRRTPRVAVAGDAGGGPIPAPPPVPAERGPGPGPAAGWGGWGGGEGPARSPSPIPTRDGWSRGAAGSRERRAGIGPRRDRSGSRVGTGRDGAGVCPGSPPRPELCGAGDPPARSPGGGFCPRSPFSRRGSRDAVAPRGPFALLPPAPQRFSSIISKAPKGSINQEKTPTQQKTLLVADAGGTGARHRPRQVPAVPWEQTNPAGPPSRRPAGSRGSSAGCGCRCRGSWHRLARGPVPLAAAARAGRAGACVNSRAEIQLYALLHLFGCPVALIRLGN